MNMSEELDDIFTEDIIDHLKNNQHEITPELLETMRSFGNRGKHLALEILDTNKDREGFYLDSFGNRMSFNGNRGLKGTFSKIDLSEIHKIEIKKCKEDIHYFKDNYIKIKTKKGVDFPDVRGYQNDFIDTIVEGENDYIIGLMGRQSGKTISTGIYLTHSYNFGVDMNIGICANRGAQAREFLNSVKNMYLALPMWMQLGTTIWNKGSIENEAGVRMLTDSPSSDAFRGYTIHCLVIDEAAFIRSTVWEEFADSIFPSQDGLAWKKNIIISTANGMNHFYNMVKDARTGSNDMDIVEVDWKDVPRYKRDGSIYKPEEFMDKIVRKHGIVYFNQNFANEFMGSSYTLVSAESLKSFASIEPEMIESHLRIYEFPEKGHKYICAVDPAKDGIDAFAVQIIDVTQFPFKQVASADMQIDYLLMPEFLSEWGTMFNTALMIIENNEGAGQSVADQLKTEHEYPNLYYDKVSRKSNRNKKYPGFRTTTRTRPQILKTLKLFIENGNLIVNDKKTINEFYTFIHVNNKYQADDGSKDDLIMCLALVFAPFTDTKNFDDLSKLVKGMYSDEPMESEFTDYLTIGNFDDFTDDSIHEIPDANDGFGEFGGSFSGYIVE